MNKTSQEPLEAQQAHTSEDSPVTRATETLAVSPTQTPGALSIEIPADLSELPSSKSLKSSSEQTRKSSPPSSLPLAIHTQVVYRSFGTGKHKVHAVNGVSLDIAPGEITALLGHNGAGKSTLIDVILGLSQPQKGSVELFGMEPRQAIRKALVGTVFQSGALLPDLTVAQTLTMLKATYLETPPLDQILAETDLADLRKRRISKLSGGEVQRLRLAIALLPNPWLLILDEPTAGMDAMMRRRFWKLMEHQAEAGRTILFATHYLQEAQDFAIRTIIMNHGRIVVDDATADVQRLGQTTTVSIDVPGVFPAHLQERWNAQVTPVPHPRVPSMTQPANPVDTLDASNDAGAALPVSAAAAHPSAARQESDPLKHTAHEAQSKVTASAAASGHTPKREQDSDSALSSGEVHVEIKTHDADQAAREVLALPGAHGLSVVPSTLEDVFAALAGADADANNANPDPSFSSSSTRRAAH